LKRRARIDADPSISGMTEHHWPIARLRAASRAAREVHQLRGPACPHCGSGLERVPRRWLDRLVGLMTPLRRYRCLSITCAWEGNLRSESSRPGKRDRRRYEHRIDSV